MKTLLWAVLSAVSALTAGAGGVEAAYPEDAPLALDGFCLIVSRGEDDFAYDAERGVFAAGEQEVKVETSFAREKSGTMVMTLAFTANDDLWATIGCQGRASLAGEPRAFSLEGILNGEPVADFMRPAAGVASKNWITVAGADGRSVGIENDTRYSLCLTGEREPGWNHWLFRAMGKEGWGMVPLMRDEPFVLRIRLVPGKL